MTDDVHDLEKQLAETRGIVKELAVALERIMHIPTYQIQPIVDEALAKVRAIGLLDK